MSYSLYLYPKVTAKTNPSQFTQQENVIHCLTQNQFLKSYIEITGIAQAGHRLMEFIVFLGCSPSLSIDNLNTLIKIHSYPESIWLGGESIETIRYPYCKHPIKNTQHLLENSSVNPNWLCAECGHAGSMFDINWRKSAGYSNWFIEIMPIFPKEALPSDALISLLERNSQYDWGWFYSRSSN